MTFDTIERARGRWREILPQLGVETRFLLNRHGPCPICGGKDRFRFDDRDGSGSYFCNQCGPGPGLLLIRKLRDWDHKTACDAVDEIIGVGKRVQQPISRSDAPNKRRRAIERILNEARYPDVVDAYLLRRGLTARSPVLQGHWRCPYYDDGGKLVGSFPAVIAPIVGPDGSLQSAQRVFTGDIGPRDRKKICLLWRRSAALLSGSWSRPMNSGSPRGSRRLWLRISYLGCRYGLRYSREI
jgi:putative DNA primase/helicase